LRPTAPDLYISDLGVFISPTQKFLYKEIASRYSVWLCRWRWYNARNIRYSAHHIM